MKTYSPEIIKAFNKWVEAIESEPNEIYDPKYQSWKAKEKRCGKKFETVCKAESLSYIEVYSDLLGNPPLTVFTLNK